MFKLNTHPTFEATVKVRVPGADEDQDFTGRFVALPIDEFNAFDMNTDEGTRTFLERAFFGASEIVDDTGAELPFDDGLKAALIGTMHTRMALVRAYVAAVEKAARGN